MNYVKVVHTVIIWAQLRIITRLPNVAKSSANKSASSNIIHNLISRCGILKIKKKKINNSKKMEMTTGGKRQRKKDRKKPQTNKHANELGLLGFLNFVHLPVF
jgi:hypothetical protein